MFPRTGPVVVGVVVHGEVAVGEVGGGVVVLCARGGQADGLHAGLTVRPHPAGREVEKLM